MLRGGLSDELRDLVKIGISRKPPRPSTLDFFLYMSNYKIREPISGQCWLTVCDAGLTLAERFVHVWGSGTIPIYIFQRP